MHASPAASQLDGMLQVQHFVINDVLDSRSRDVRMVEDPAHNNGIVCGIIVAEAVSGSVRAPGKARSAQQRVKESGVEMVEDFFQIVGMSYGGGQAFPPANLPDQMGFSRHLMAGDIAAITKSMLTPNRFPVEFGKQHMRQGAQYGVRRPLKHVRNANQQPAFPHADGAVDVGKGEKLHRDIRQNTLRAQLAVRLVKNLEKAIAHVEFRLA